MVEAKLRNVLRPYVRITSYNSVKGKEDSNMHPHHCCMVQIGSEKPKFKRREV